MASVAPCKPYRPSLGSGPSKVPEIVRRRASERIAELQEPPRTGVDLRLPVSTCSQCKNPQQLNTNTHAHERVHSNDTHCGCFPRECLTICSSERTLGYAASVSKDATQNTHRYQPRVKGTVIPEGSRTTRWPLARQGRQAHQTPRSVPATTQKKTKTTAVDALHPSEC